MRARRRRAVDRYYSLLEHHTLLRRGGVCARSDQGGRYGHEAGIARRYVSGASPAALEPLQNAGLGVKGEAREPLRAERTFSRLDRSDTSRLGRPPDFGTSAAPDNDADAVKGRQRILLTVSAPSSPPLRWSTRRTRLVTRRSPPIACRRSSGCDIPRDDVGADTLTPPVVVSVQQPDHESAVRQTRPSSTS
jgi:hypothetical protein